MLRLPPTYTLTTTSVPYTTLFRSRKDFLLRQFSFEAQREQNFLELAGEGALVAEEHIARELHRERAAALALLAGQREYERGAHQALPVDAREIGSASCRERVCQYV